MKSEQSRAPYYIKLHLGDYERDTVELSPLQDGMYFRLMRWYYSTANPIPNDISRIYRRVHALSVEEQEAVKYVLENFFLLDGPVWRQKRIDHEIGEYMERSETAKYAAQRSVENRQKRSERLSTARKLGTHTKTEFEILKVVCGDKCVRCGTDEWQLERDHIVPIYQGGSDSIDNIQPLCAKCNSSKGPEDIDHRPQGWIEKFNEIKENGLANAERPLSDRLTNQNQNQNQNQNLNSKPLEPIGSCEAEASQPVDNSQNEKAKKRREDARFILGHLNAKAGRNFKPVPATLKPIEARLKEFSRGDCLRVINLMVEKWDSDEKMYEYLRPSTLFRASNFADYNGLLTTGPKP